MTNNENLYAKGKKILASGMTMGEKTEEKNPEVDKFEDASKAAEKAVKEAEKAEKATFTIYEIENYTLKSRAVFKTHSKKEANEKYSELNSELNSESGHSYYMRVM